MTEQLKNHHHIHTDAGWGNTLSHIIADFLMNCKVDLAKITA